MEDLIDFSMIIEGDVMINSSHYVANFNANLLILNEFKGIRSFFDLFLSQFLRWARPEICPNFNIRSFSQVGQFAHICRRESRDI